MKSHALIWVCFTLAVLGCRHESDSQQEVSPLLNTIPGQSVVAGKTLTISLLDATNTASGVFTTDGTVGPNKNPYAELTPATFDASQGIFAWTPTDAEAGDYSVLFTATGESSAPASVSQTVNITVYTPAQFGMRLFGEHCATCHGVNATGLSAKAVLLKTRDDIAHALDSVPDMASLNTALTDEEIDWISLGLASLRARLAEHPGVDPTAACDGCHDGEKASGKTIIHIATTTDCRRCHNTEIWIPVETVDHTQVFGTCVSCHDSQTASGKSTTHKPTTLSCMLCHLVSAWLPPDADHSKLGDLPCVACHDSVAPPI